MPWAWVRILRVGGTSLSTGKRMNIVKDRTFDGPLSRQIEGAQQLVSSLLREFQFLGEDGRFETIPEYPEFAWFEGLVNAVTHRNYAFSGDYICVTMYEDPVLARALVEIGWVRELNEGVQRIYDEMAGYFLNDPLYTEPNNSSVLLTLENSATSRVLRQNDSLTTKALDETTGKAPTLCARTLKGLSSGKGLLVWHGSSIHDPSQYYSLDGTAFGAERP